MANKMCGICGALSYTSGEFLEPVKAMTAMMVRRGPDDEGYWRDADNCALGFRRLSIQDLSMAGHQPMLSRDGRYTLVFNGEIYNFRELRKELQKTGVRFRSTGDSEVVLNALALWGHQALSRFNGMFAIGFYDSVEKSLLLARDHAGIKPLYYMSTAEGVVFASQYDQIMAHPASKNLSVSIDALALYLRRAYIPQPYGILEHTHMLEAGTWLKIHANGHIIRGTFFDFPRYSTPDLKGMEAWEAVDAAVTNAVKRSLISDVPVGTFLSGGIDSPLITAKAYEISERPIKAFTIGTNGDKFDESSDATAYAKEIGIEHILERVTPDDCIGLLDDVVAACGEPFGDFSIFPTLLVTRLARREVKVMLSGDGGDEPFLGYAKRFAAVIRGAPDFVAPLPWRYVRWALKRYLGLGGGYYNLCFASIGDWFRAKHGLLQEDQLSRIFKNPPAWPSDCTLYDFKGHNRDETAQWLRWNEYTGRMQMILLKVDRASMYNSLEVRVPLLDREVVDTAARIDWKSCLDIDNVIGKLPLRHALRKHLKYHTVAKKGFTVSMDVWLRGPLREVFEDTVLAKNDLLGFQLNRNGLNDIYNKLLRNEDAPVWGLWILLSLSLWEERYYKRYR